jgi:purine catabolism regulator
VPLEDCGGVRIHLMESLDALEHGEILFDSGTAGRRRAALARGLGDLVAAKRPELTVALAGYLRHRGNWERASRDLGIHRNTLRYRVDQCRARLDVDLDDPDISAELWLLMRDRGIA